MHEVEIPVRVGMVAALVRAAALLARQGAGRDQASERIGVSGELAQLVGIAYQPSEAPERGPGRLRALGLGAALSLAPLALT